MEGIKDLISAGAKRIENAKLNYLSLTLNIQSLYSEVSQKYIDR